MLVAAVIQTRRAEPMSEDQNDHAPAWNDFPEVEEHFKPLIGTDQTPYRYEMDGTEPVTEGSSKTVMLQAGRRDEIHITAVVDRFIDGVDIPGTVSVIKRQHTYYGPELMVHAERDGEDYNYLLTAPGPDAHLLFWVSESEEDEEGRRWRKKWKVGAEVTAMLSEDPPKYSFCRDCGEPIQTLQHEREAAFGFCSRAQE